MLSIMKPELTEFQWKPCPEGQELLDELIDSFVEESPRTKDLQKAMSEKTGTRFFDWIDHLQVAPDETLTNRLESAGFTESDQTWEHHGALFPRIRIGEERRIILNWSTAINAAPRAQAGAQGCRVLAYRDNRRLSIRRALPSQAAASTTRSRSSTAGASRSAARRMLT